MASKFKMLPASEHPFTTGRQECHVGMGDNQSPTHHSGRPLELVRGDGTGKWPPRWNEFHHFARHPGRSGSFSEASGVGMGLFWAGFKKGQKHKAVIFS